MANGTLKREKSEDVSPLNAKKPHIQDKNGANENDSANNATSLTDLPNEIIGKITDMLSIKDLFNLEGVNKRMQEIALNVAWPRRNTLDYDSLNYGAKDDKACLIDKISDTMFESILSRANIKYLDLSGYSHKITHQICFQLHLAPQLIKLDLSYLNINNDSLQNIGISCPLLEHVSFNYCCPDEKIDDGLGFFFKHCPNLKYLDLIGNDFSGDCFAHISTKLRYLNLYFCDSISSNGMELLSKRAKDLETLVMHNFNPTSDVNIWLKNFTKLRFLQISSLEKENLPSLDFSHLKELEMLSLRENKLVTAETVKSLKHCTKLKGLDLYFNNRLDGSYSLKELESCKNLKYCDFGFLKNLNINLVDFVQTRKLEYLGINECYDIPEIGLKSLITGCHSLTRLEAWGYYNDEAISSALSQECLTRSNILLLSVKNEDQNLSSNEWCEVVSMKWHGFFITHAITENKTSL